MTTFELHIQVNQRYQEVASYKRDKFKPEELDLALNKAMYRLLEMGASTNFQDTHINLSHVAALIQKNRSITLIHPSPTEPMYEHTILSGYTPLPPDFYWLVNARADSVTDRFNCGVAPIGYTSTLTEFVAAMPFVMPNTAGPYYSRVEIVTSSPIVAIYDSPYDPLNDIGTAFNSKKSKYVIINNVVESFYRNPTIKCYWERYRDTFYKDSFVFVSNTNFGNITMATYESNRIGHSNIATVSSVATNYIIYNVAATLQLPNAILKIAPISVTKATDTYQVLKQNPFYGTKPNNILAEVDQDYIRVYRDESFLVPRIHYDYIRKPRTISLALNQSCELADTTHNKIVDLAVEILRLDTKDPAYPQSVQDTQVRTT